MDELSGQRLGESPRGNDELTTVAKLLSSLRDGARLDLVADKEGLTTQQVRSLFRSFGIDRDALKALRSTRTTPHLGLPADLRAIALWRDGCPLNEIARRTGVAAEHVARTISDVFGVRVSTAIVDERAPELGVAGAGAMGVRSRWSDAAMLEALQLAATMAFPLSVAEYDALRLERFIDGPSAQLVAIRFGNWSTACDRAGVECGTVPRRSYGRAWSNAEILAIVNEYLARAGGVRTFDGYGRWAAASGFAPSAATVRVRLGTWANVLRAAGADKHPEGGQTRR
jgi:hypothetical protein